MHLVNVNGITEDTTEDITEDITDDNTISEDNNITKDIDEDNIITIDVTDVNNKTKHLTTGFGMICNSRYKNKNAHFKSTQSEKKIQKKRN